MITDKDVADMENEVKMLRLQIAEHKAHRRLNEIEQSELTDVGALREANETIHNAKTYIDALEADLSNSKSAIMMKNGVINDRNETISDLRMAASDMLDTINECSRKEAEDSRVLMKVVKAVDTWHRCMIPTSLTGCTDLIKVLDDVLEDYSDAQESPVVTLKTPSMGTRVVSKNEEAHVIDGAKMEAVRMLVGSDMWVLHTDDEAVEDKQQKDTIDELTETTGKLESRLSAMCAVNSDQHTTIDELKDFIRELGDELADEKMVLAAYRNNPLSDQVADRDNRIEQLMVSNEALRVDIDGRDRHIEELKWSLKLERIDHTAEMSAVKKTLRDTIKGLKTDLDARNQVIKDFKVIETKETDRLHKIIDEFRDSVLRSGIEKRSDKITIDEFRDSVLRSGIEKRSDKITIDELNDMYCDACGKLERIEKIAGPSVRGRVCTRESICRAINEIIVIVEKSNPIDEITKIIQEE